MSSPQQVDSIIKAKWILPMVPAKAILENCALIVAQGKIIDLVPQEHVADRYQAPSIFDLSQHIVMPGLVNGHAHSAMTLLRGYADDLPLMTWLNEHIWPAEGQWVDREFVFDGTELAIAEMILGGTTYFNDMYFFPDECANVVKKAGIKAQISCPILDFPTAWGKDAEEYIHKCVELHQHYRNDTNITIAFGPHAPYTVSDGPLKQIATLSEQLDAKIHMHIHETAEEVLTALRDSGKRPITRLADLGLITPHLQCVHMTHLDDNDIQVVSNGGASVVHCPESNMKLASGLCPAQKLLDNGICVGLGTDGAASNNDLSMLGELASAALLGKITANDASAVGAFDALYMATLGGAKALGVDNEIGSLERGKSADVIALKTGHVSLFPSYDLISQLVYSNRDLKVTHSWVNGHPLLLDGHLLTLNIEAITAKASEWQARIAGK